MKHIMLTDDALTNSCIFLDYDQAIEPVLCSYLSQFSKTDDQTDLPDIQVFDATHAFPLSDPGNEQIFLIKLDGDANDAAYNALGLIATHEHLKNAINPLLDQSGDYAANLDAIFQTNYDTYLLFTYCK